MRLRHRWELMKLAVGLYSNPSSKQAYDLLTGLFPGKTGVPPARGVVDFLRAYSRCPWLRAVVAKTADTVAAANWQVMAVRAPGEKARLVRSLQDAGYANRKKLLKDYRKAGELDVIEKHPAMEFIHGGNQHMTGRAVRRINSIYRDLVGEWFVIKERNVFGAPVAQWPIPGNWIEDTPVPAHPFYRVSWAAWQGEIPETEIMWFRDHDPVNPYSRGTGIAYALADELETDEFTAKHIKSFFWNQARPDLLIMPAKDEDEWSDPSIEQAKARWMQEHQGFWRVFKPHWFNRRVQVEQISQTFESMQLVPLREYERNVFLQVYGFSPEALGIIENSNRATIDAASYMVQRYIALPRLEDMRGFYQKYLVAEYDNRIVIDYESPIDEDKEFALRVAEAMPSSRLLDEWRELGGLEELPGGKGKVYPVEAGIRFTRDLEEEPEQYEPTPPKEPAVPGEEGGEVIGEEEGKAFGKKKLTA